MLNFSSFLAKQNRFWNDMASTRWRTKMARAGRAIQAPDAYRAQQLSGRPRSSLFNGNTFHLLLNEQRPTEFVYWLFVYKWFEIFLLIKFYFVGSLFFYTSSQLIYVPQQDTSLLSQWVFRRAQSGLRTLHIPLNCFVGVWRIVHDLFRHRKALGGLKVSPEFGNSINVWDAIMASNHFV